MPEYLTEYIRSNKKEDACLSASSLEQRSGSRRYTEPCPFP